MSSSRYKDQFVRLLINQFCDSENIKKLGKLNAESYDSIDDVLAYIYDNFNVELATGVWLDLIGVIVGQSRIVMEDLGSTFFGFNGGGWERFNFGYFWDGQSGLTNARVLTDDEYRKIIKHRINHNYADCTIRGLSTALSLLSDSVSIVRTVQSVDHAGGGDIDLWMNDNISESEVKNLIILDVLPIAAGIGVRNFFFGMNPFAFRDCAGTHTGFNDGLFINSL